MNNIDENEYMDYNGEDNYLTDVGGMVKDGYIAQEDNKSVKTLCVLSLIFMIAGFVVPYIVVALASAMGFDTEDLSENMSWFWLILGGFEPASIILMIIARVKNSKSVFAKVLMWIWIAMIVLTLVTIILLMIGCTLFLNELRREGGCT